MQFSNNLKQIRLSKSLSQQALSKKARITRSAYSYYERGLRKPDAEVLYQLAAALEVRIDFLYNTDYHQPVSTLEYYSSLSDAGQELLDIYHNLAPFSQGRLLQIARAMEGESSHTYSVLRLGAKKPGIA